MIGRLSSLISRKHKVNRAISEATDVYTAGIILGATIERLIDNAAWDDLEDTVEALRARVEQITRDGSKGAVEWDDVSSTVSLIIGLVDVYQSREMDFQEIVEQARLVAKQAAEAKQAAYEVWG